MPPRVDAINIYVNLSYDSCTQYVQSVFDLEEIRKTIQTVNIFKNNYWVFVITQFDCSISYDDVYVVDDVTRFSCVFVVTGVNSENRKILLPTHPFSHRI
jgi:hypothetical protein